MAFDFPSSPTNGQEYTSGGITYAYNGYGWSVKGAIDPNNFVKKTGDTMTGDLTVSKTDPRYTLNITDTSTARISGQRNGVNRWNINFPSGEAETGSNAGSNFIINRFDDAGVNTGQVLNIRRSDGQVNIPGFLNSTGGFGCTGGTTSINGTVINIGGGPISVLGTSTFSALATFNARAIGVYNGQIQVASAQGAFEIQSNSVTEPCITFHRVSSFAMNFGMKSDGNLHFGGYSHGTTSWQLWSKRDFSYVPANGANYVAKTGDTMSGALTVAGSLRSSTDVWASNTATTGYYHFGTSGSKYLQFDGTRYSLIGGLLNLSAGHYDPFGYNSGWGWNGGGFYCAAIGSTGWQRIWVTEQTSFSQAATGYIRFVNGFLIQWGLFGGGGGNDQWVYFPVAFGAVVGVHCQGYGNNSYQEAITATVRNDMATTAFVIQPRYINNGGVVGNATQQYMWLAYGW